MQHQELIPHLFRTEYRKITAVLCKLFGIDRIEVAEDIASETFLHASELWGLRGLPENPTAWLYTVAKNKAKDYLKRDTLYYNQIVQQVQLSTSEWQEPDIDLSEQNIKDSQLQMMFAICHPAIPPEAQIGLSLRILCGFGIDEIAAAFLSKKETINKRLHRAREKLRELNVKIELPGEAEINQRLDSVLATLYLLFNEGYYSQARDITMRKDVSLEAIRLTHLLTGDRATSKPAVHALLALMSFHASRFEARLGQNGETVLYQDQDEKLWDTDLVKQGEYFMQLSWEGDTISKYHLEAGIAYWHTIKADSAEKWESILQFYNHLLIIQYSPMAALNRTYALAKANGKQEAITEAEKLGLTGNHLYHSLLGELYIDVDNNKALTHLKTALGLMKSKGDREVMEKKIAGIETSDQHIGFS